MNLLMLSIDSLRWDTIARTHPDLLHTPHFDRLTRAFSFTDRCISVSTTTRPVHQSIFSGLYPFEHGITGQHRRQRRSGIPCLLDVFQQHGRRVAAFSEAATILSGVDLGVEVQQLAPEADAGLGQIRQWLTKSKGPRTLFVHYWCTHAPYGAADGRAMGATAELVAQGRADVVIERYRTAVANCFEARIAPLLESLDLSAWTVVIFGDHGERWTARELYHGRTLHHDTVRVPLFLHVPYVNAQPTGNICSLIDLYATVARLFDLPDRASQGRDLLAPVMQPLRYLAQIEPTPSTSAGQDTPLLLGRDPSMPAQDERMIWSVFDEEHRWTWEERTSTAVWSKTFDPRQTPLDPVPGLDAPAYLQRMRAQSPYVTLPLQDGIDADVLNQRLRDLGYLA